MKTAHVFIRGMVQGVFFRHHARRRAEELGITGWVKNLPDGRVEAVFSGDEIKIKEMINWCEHGSPLSHVEDVEVNWEKEERFSVFDIRH